MPARPTKLYPIKNRWLHDQPAAVHVVETKAEADELIGSGAFTDDPKDPARDHDAPDLTEPAPEASEVPIADRPAGQRHTEAALEVGPPAEGEPVVGVPEG